MNSSHRQRILAKVTAEAIEDVDQQIAEGTISLADRDEAIEQWIEYEMDEYELAWYEDMRHRQEQGEMDDSPCLEPQQFMSFHG